MSARDLISELEILGITLTPVDGRLSVSAPAGVVTDAIRQKLTSHKQELLAILSVEEPLQNDKHEPFPLSDIQRAYLVGRSEEMPLGGIGCHFYREFESDNLDPERLQAAWRRVIDKHDMLRAIVTRDGMQQMLQDTPTWHLAVDNWRNLGGDEAARCAAETREAMAHAVFTSDQWPLFDIRMSLLPGGKQLLHFGFDLLVVDASGIRRLFEDWESFYEDPARPASRSRFSFREYVLRLRHQERTPQFAEALQYWGERIKVLPGPPDLPLAVAPAIVRKPRFARRQASLEAPVWHALQQVAAEWGITQSTLVCAAFAEILGHWSRRRDLTLTLTFFQGLPVHPQVRELVGDFTSTLLLACDASGRDFRERAIALQRRLAEDLNHSRVTGIRAMRECVDSSENVPPYGFPVVFTSALGHRGGSELNWLGKTVYTLTETPQVWLDHVVLEESGSLILSWDAVENLFPERLLDDMFAAEQRLLSAIATRAVGAQQEIRPEGWLFSAAQERERGQWNETESEVSTGLLHEAFLTRAKLQPDHPAVIDVERTLLYGELDLQARRLADLIVSEGVSPGDRVAILLPKSWRQPVAVLACSYCGAVFVALDPEAPAPRLRKLIERVSPTVILATGNARLSSIATKVIAIEFRGSGHAIEPIVEGNQRTGQDEAYIIFTSGSTGEPKGVVIDHCAALNTIDDVNTRCRISPSDRLLSLSALYFDLAIYDIFGTLGAGGTVILPNPGERANPEHWKELVRRYGVTVWNSVPALFSMAVDSSAADATSFGSLRWVLLSGDWIPPPLIDAARPLARNASFVSMGGATEASIWSIWHDIGERSEQWSSVPYGRPMRNQKFYILDSQLDDCPVWVPGQLYIAGAGLARGYWNDPERTAAQFVTHPRSGERLYATGDLGRYRPGGVIEFLGREDQQVKINGYRVELGEIEAAMLRHPQVESALVLAKGEAFDLKQLVGYVVLKQASDNFWQPAAEPDVLTDSAERVAARLALLAAADGERSNLPAGKTGKRIAQLAERRTCRRFTTAPISLEALGGLLSCLRPTGENEAGLPLFVYPSAGHLYQISVFLYVREGRVPGFTGYYRYSPHSHQLISVAESTPTPRAWHVKQNQSIFGESSFSIYLVANLENVRPFYGSAARDLCLLEAGYLGQTLMLAAADQGLALCAIGGLDSAGFNAQLGLSESQQLLHSFVGGIPATADSRSDVPDFYESSLRVTPTALRLFLQRELPSYMVPSTVVTLREFPVTRNGKIDRKALLDPIADTPSFSLETEPEVSWLSGLVSELLGGISIDNRASFFELGATSLHLIELAKRLQSHGKAVSVTDLFRSPNIIALAKHLNATEPDSLRQAALARGLSKRMSNRVRSKVAL